MFIPNDPNQNLKESNQALASRGQCFYVAIATDPTDYQEKSQEYLVRFNLSDPTRYSFVKKAQEATQFKLKSSAEIYAKNIDRRGLALVQIVLGPQFTVNDNNSTW